MKIKKLWVCWESNKRLICLHSKQSFFANIKQERNLQSSTFKVSRRKDMDTWMDSCKQDTSNMNTVSSVPYVATCINTHAEGCYSDANLKSMWQSMTIRSCNCRTCGAVILLHR